MPAKENRQSATYQVRSVSKDDRTVDIVASTFDIDSYGTRIDPQGWELEQFKKNPVICLQHDSHGKSPSVGLPIANAIPETVRVENGKLLMRVRFPKQGVFPLADQVFDLVADGFLRGVSVGFQPMEYEDVEEGDGEESKNVRIYRRSLLLEVSFVTIPSNDNALVQRARDLNREDDVERFRKITREVETMAEEEASDLTWDRCLPVRFNVANEAVAPAALEYEWVAKHIGCKVKEVFQNSFTIPPYRNGGFLSGLKNALLGNTLTDVRNLTWHGTELPPEYNVIELNSRSSDDFLVNGIAFYKGEEGKFAYHIYPTWFGLHIDLYTHREAKDFNRRIVDESWRFAREQNPLKGEAFSLSGEFIRTSGETWDDCFLEEKNTKALTRIVERINKKGKETPNRGVILMGPPGTGKTLSGRIIRNTLKDASFIWVSTRDFHFGGGFTQAFELAREIAPSVLFFEDIDNWVGGNIDLLKTEMDGIARSTGVVTIMTTNFPERLPEALIDRPGRFHDVLNFNLPTDEKRAAMLRKWVEGLSESDIKAAVEKTKGYSGAHMYELASFTRNLQESDDLSVSDALREALKKIEEQRELITKVQLSGSNYRPKLRGLKKTATLSTDMKQPTVDVRVTDLPELQDHLSGLKDRVSDMEKDFDKYKSYFERKQPANRAATKVLAKFFKARGLETPSDEVEAWERMEELLTQTTTVEVKSDEQAVTETAVAEVEVKDETPVEEPVKEEVKEEPKPEAPAEEKAEEVKEEAKEVAPEAPVEKAEEPAPAPAAPAETAEETPPASPNPSPAAEAPQPGRKASVHITLSALKALPEVLGKAMADEAAAALRRGMPSKDLGGYLDNRGDQLLKSLIHS